MTLSEYVKRNVLGVVNARKPVPVSFYLLRKIGLLSAISVGLVSRYALKGL
jgi:hypothetical protein